MRDTMHVAAKRRLRELIVDQAGRDCTQLPAEEDLAGLLGVSRATLRTALVSLQKEGLVRREHGRGTFVQRRAAALTANLGQDRPFLDVIRDCGHVAGASARVSGPVTADVSGLPSPALAIERRFTADGRPAVAAYDLVPLDLLRAPWGRTEPEDSIFDFCRAWCGREVAYSIAEIIPAAADSGVASALDLETGTPLILLQHLHLADGDEPLAVTRAYINDSLVRFAVVRAGSES